MKTGITSSRKLIGRSSPAFSVSMGTLTDFPPKTTVSSLLPSALGVSVLPTRVTDLVSASENLASPVTSLVNPLAYVACTISD